MLQALWLSPGELRDKDILVVLGLGRGPQGWLSQRQEVDASTPVPRLSSTPPHPAGSQPGPPLPRTGIISPPLTLLGWTGPRQGAWGRETSALDGPAAAGRGHGDRQMRPSGL